MSGNFTALANLFLAAIPMAALCFAALTDVAKAI